MAEKNDSLASYAARLYRLSGGETLAGSLDAYFVPLDEARRASEEEGRRFVSFANYDYLGLSRHPEVEQAVIEALERFGTGALASRIVGGERSIHREFERALADFAGTEEALVLVSGFLTNSSLISHLMGANDCVVIDELSHASILAGTKCSRATVYKFRHNDLDDLARVLAEKRAAHSHCLIAVEGLYSMDGDVPDLPGLLDLKDKFRAWLLVDEAHSHGVLGPTGRGLAEHFGEDPGRIDIVVGTLSKALVSCGGFIAASRQLVDFLRFSLPGFVFSVGMAPMLTASAMKALEIARREPWRTAALASNTEFFLARARAAGLDTGPAIGRAVVPVLFPTTTRTTEVSRQLMAAGFYAPPIIQIAVPKDLPRIRFFFSAAHEKDDIARLVDVLAAAGAGTQPSLEEAGTRAG